MRIVTRPDFDGIVCAVFLYEVLEVTSPTCWLSAADIQSGEWNADEGDVIANLPYHPDCSLWFDHHASNQLTCDFEGAFSIAPSAARVIFEYYKDILSPKYKELVEVADKIDSAQLTLDEILDLGCNPYFLLAITLEENYGGGQEYWDWIVDMLRTRSIESIMKESDVEERCLTVFNDHDLFRIELLKHTVMDGAISVTDFRSLETIHSGNRFLVYCLFPDCISNVKICGSKDHPDVIRCSIGHNIFNRGCVVSAGELLKRYNGGGHFGAGGASLDIKSADKELAEIISILKLNKPL